MSKARKSANRMVPGDITHPGAVLYDELVAREMTQKALADKMKLSKSEISLLLNGHRNITPAIAVALERVLGIDAEFWMNLQIKHDIDRIRRKARRDIDAARISPARKRRLKQFTA